ncbi:MAG: hypothetical protein Q9191_005161 [Dirinaria sp. TL-2023a]
MDSMRSLNKSLPRSPSKQRRGQPPEQLLQAFKAAALSVTTLYKTAASDQAGARAAGYQDALDDILAFLDKEHLGLGDGEGWKVRQWATERLDGSPVSTGNESDEDRDSSNQARGSSPLLQRGEVPYGRQASRPPSPVRTVSTASQTSAPVQQPNASAAPRPEVFTFTSPQPYPQDMDVQPSDPALRNASQLDSHPPNPSNSTTSTPYFWPTTLTACKVGLILPGCSSAPMSLQRDRVPAAPHGADQDFSSTSHIGTNKPRMDRLALLALALWVTDVFEEFIGSPLLASKIEGSYDLVAQLLGEMCDAGSVCNTEPNALRDDVEVTGWMGKLLGGVGLPGSSPALLPSGGLKQQLNINPSNSSSATNGPAIPWRRANVRHTSNELYVDIVETLSVNLAPSGRPLSAFANGSIAFTSKISGVPDLLLTLSASGGKLGLERAIELPVFHPCVRLARWKDRPGELSFVPPDGKFILAGYEVDLLPSHSDVRSWANSNVQLPISLEVSKSLGPTGADFEINLLLSPPASISTNSSSSVRPGLGSARGSGRSTPVFGSSAASSSSPLLQDVVVTVPIPKGSRNITDLRASRGEAYFTPMDNVVEWRLPAKDTAVAGSATLRCTIVGPVDEEDEEEAMNGFRTDTTNREYNEFETYQGSSSEPAKPASSGNGQRQQQEQRDIRKVEQNRYFMPKSASVSFSVKGWLASGIRVDGLVVDTRKSRGLGEGVRPYKGVKYLTVSRKGVETSHPGDCGVASDKTIAITSPPNVLIFAVSEFLKQAPPTRAAKKYDLCQSATTLARLRRKDFA